MDKSNYGVHAAHCCKWHGCKYGDPDCPVVLGEITQMYLCYDCCRQLENEDYYKWALKTIEEIKQFKKEKK